MVVSLAKMSGLKKSDQSIEALLNAREAYLVNELMVIKCMLLLNKVKLEENVLNFPDFLFFMMELLSYEAQKKGILLELVIEPGFPNHVTLDMAKVELILTQIIRILISKQENNQITILADTKQPIENGFLLSICLETKNNDSLSHVDLQESVEGISNIIEKGKNYLSCTSILTALQGKIETNTKDEKIIFGIEIPVTFFESSINPITLPMLDLFETERIGSKCTRWTANRIKIVKSKPKEEHSGDFNIKREELAKDSGSEKENKTIEEQKEIDIETPEEKKSVIPIENNSIEKVTEEAKKSDQNDLLEEAASIKDRPIVIPAEELKKEESKAAQNTTPEKAMKKAELTIIREESGIEKSQPEIDEKKEPNIPLLMQNTPEEEKEHKHSQELENGNDSDGSFGEIENEYSLLLV